MREQLVDIAIWGAGGFGREVAWLIKEINDQKKKYRIVGFLDDNPDLSGRQINGYRVLGGYGLLEQEKPMALALAIGDPFVRCKLMRKLSRFELLYPNLVHPSVSAGMDNVMGQGNIFCSGSIVTVNVKIGNHCHFNLKSTIGHDCELDDFTTSACSVDFAGYSKTGMGVYCGNQSTLLPSVFVERFSLVGAGAVVNGNVAEGSVVVGVPAKIVKKNKLYSEWRRMINGEEV